MNIEFFLLFRLTLSLYRDIMVLLHIIHCASQKDLRYFHL